MTISNETNAAGCQVGFYKDGIYLLEPYLYKQRYNIVRYNFIRRQSVIPMAVYWKAKTRKRNTEKVSMPQNWCTITTKLPAWL